MGLGDFSLQSNKGKQEKLSDIRGDIRRETVDKKYQKLFDFFDTNKNGAIEGKEAALFEGVIAQLAGDKVLSAKEVKSVFAQLGIKNTDNADFLGFVKSISDASEKIQSFEESTLPDGSRKVVTNYIGGARLTAVYYPDGELKYTIKEVPTIDTSSISNSAFDSKGREVSNVKRNTPKLKNLNVMHRKAEFSDRAMAELKLAFGETFTVFCDGTAGAANTGIVYINDTINANSPQKIFFIIILPNFKTPFFIFFKIYNTKNIEKIHVMLIYFCKVL
jgi:hypothetical protein